MDYSKYIASIPDYPIKGVLFRDITPLLEDGDAFRSVCDEFTKFARDINAEVIVGPESRGFIFGCPVANNLKVGFVPARKPNKLPRETIRYEYSLEYGTAAMEVVKTSIKPGQKVLIIDDLLATGGTIKAAIKLCESLGAEVVGCAFLIELDDLKGRQQLEGYNVLSLLHYEGE